MIRLYALLLRLLYPKSFRHEYGAEMLAILRTRLHRASRLAERLPLFLQTLLDLLADAALTHLDLLRQDLRYCLRSLRRTPAFTLAAVSIMALAIGAASSVLNLADRVFLKPFPFPESERLVRLWESKPGYQMEISPPNFRDWKNTATSFESFSAWRWQAVNLTGGDQPLHLEGASVTADLFACLAVQPLLGRTFSLADDRLDQPLTILLSESLWRDRFGADPAILGRSLSLDGKPHIVVGVMPASLQFPSRQVRFWTPMRFAPVDFQDRSNNYLMGLARLKPGVSLEQAESEMRLITARLERQFPKENKNTGALVLALRDQIGARSRLILWALAGAALCFFLIANLNLASLFLTRALSRRRELSIRTALGAAPERLIRQLATESFLLALAAALLGLALADAALPALTRLIPESLPIAPPQLDLRAAAITFALAFAAALLFGVIPALRVTRIDATAAGLREGERHGTESHRRHGRAALVVAEIAISITLLVAAGLLLRALWNVQSVDPGFQSDGVLTLRTPLPMPRYERTELRTRFYRHVIDSARALPGVRQAAYVSFLPIQMRGGIWPVAIGGVTEGGRTENHTASLRFVTPGYFDAMRIPLLQGRDVSDSDTLQSPLAAVVSQSFVDRYWPGQNPLGRHFRFAEFDRQVVGVAGNVKVRGLERVSEPQVYLPYRQDPDGAFTWYAPKDLVLATTSSADPATLLPALRRIIREADPDQPVTNVQSLAELVATDSAVRRFQVRLLAAFAALAALLAAVGLYGLASFGVSRRTREFGVRLALGAQSRDVFRLVFTQSLTLTATGIALGAVLAATAAAALQSLLFGVPPADPLTWSAAIGLSLFTTLAGALVPAYRAARVDPLEAIRQE